MRQLKTPGNQNTAGGTAPETFGSPSCRISLNIMKYFVCFHFARRRPGVCCVQCTRTSNYCSYHDHGTHKPYAFRHVRACAHVSLNVGMYACACVFKCMYLIKIFTHSPGLYIYMHRFQHIVSKKHKTHTHTHTHPQTHTHTKQKNTHKNITYKLPSPMTARSLVKTPRHGPGRRTAELLSGKLGKVYYISYIESQI